MRRLRVVIDANVLVSACFGGISFDLVLLAFATSRLFMSPDIEAELTKLADGLSSKIGDEKALEFRTIVAGLINLADKVDPDKEVDVCRDKSDNKYLSLCLAAKADYLVTGDKDLTGVDRAALDSIGLKSLKILSPSEFLLEMTRE